MVLPLNPISLAGSPATNITPFTYRDGLTFLARLERLAKYINSEVVPYVEKSYSELSSETVAKVNNLVAEVNALADTLLDNSVEIQEEVLARIAQLSSSDFRKVLDELYAGSSVETEISTGRLSKKAIDSQIETAVKPLLANAGIVVIDATRNPYKSRINKDGEAFTGQALWIAETTPANRIGGDIVFIVSREPLPWDPNDIDGVIAWYDPRKLNTSDGSQITVFEDSSENGRVMRAWTEGKFAYKADAMAGTPGIIATSNTTGLETETFEAISGPVSIYANVKVTNATNTAFFAGGGLETSSEGFGVYKSYNPARWGMRRNTTFADGMQADAEPHSIIAIFDGADSRIYVDGALASEGSLGVEAFTRLNLSGRNFNGGITGGLANGSIIGDVVFANSIPNQYEIDAATYWLKTRRGV